MAQHSTKTVLSRILFAGYILALCLICFVSADSIPDIQKTIFGIPTDKVIHFTMFAPFAFLTYLSFDHPAKKGWNSVLFFLLSLVAGCLVAFATEVVQSYLPSRAMDIKDFYADSLALVSTGLFVLIIDLTHKK